MAKNNRNGAEDKMLAAIDERAAFEEFKDALPYQLRRDILNGMPAAELYKKYEDYAAARVIAIAIAGRDNKDALQAAKDIQDRTQGKAVERKDVRHRMENAPEKDIDAALLSEIEDLQSDDTLQ